jgi:hypothetical protein
MPDTEVRFQPTPNPNAGKFIVNRTVVEGKSSRSFYNREQASSDPMASALFGLDGVASIFMVDDFVTVTKEQAADWSELIPRVIETMEQVLA